MKRELNLRDLGGILAMQVSNGRACDGIIPKGLFLRSGKLSILTAQRELIEMVIEKYR